MSLPKWVNGKLKLNFSVFSDLSHWTLVCALVLCIVSHKIWHTFHLQQCLILFKQLEVPFNFYFTLVQFPPFPPSRNFHHVKFSSDLRHCNCLFPMQLVPLIGQVEERFLWVEEDVKMLKHICRRKGVKNLQKKTSTPVWSLALLSKYWRPRAAAASAPALGLTTRRSPRSAWFEVTV